MGPTLTFAIRRVLRDFELDCESTVDRWPLVLLGPSGSGKTQLLRVLAGLERRASGRIALGDEVWLGEGTWTPPHLRPIGYCSQEGDLFPHLSVLENVAFPLRFRSQLSRVERLDRAREWLERLRVGHLAQSAPAAISGGERGRVALARALAGAPRLVLADEPFAAVDQTARMELSEQVAEVLAGLPVIWVTHDADEAELLGRRGFRLELRNGRIQALSGYEPSR
ncbi:MAG: ATP-binding cassette domain-containing protein [Candidatus Eisenbacteria bacterium]|uniref:ATP-binding cassette domain-containing protein n=1 Tax=Eiseniibacteriota bacterium TaxID=2212470 RepID=A0A956NGJ2_UNCEI|nr:ATP-binding cassette domain-containing protein [Candidatus Eisenbacteria bacterium]MCB9463792.1 ATP-binding cassette domain-containing protein [Candidatus Eisenbacteria bacterium]